MRALSASTACRFSSRKYSPRGVAPVGRTRNAVSDVGAAPNEYVPDVASGASVTQPSWLNDQASMRDGLEGEEKFPAPIRLQRPTPAVLSLVRSEAHTSELQSRFDLVC